MSASAPPPPQYFPPSDVHPQQPKPAPYPQQPQSYTHPAPPPHYGHPNQSSTSVYVISPPGNIRLGKYPIYTTCPFCQQQVENYTKFQNNYIYRNTFDY